MIATNAATPTQAPMMTHVVVERVLLDPTPIAVRGLTGDAGVSDSTVQLGIIHGCIITTAVYIVAVVMSTGHDSRLSLPPLFMQIVERAVWIRRVYLVPDTTCSVPETICTSCS